MRTATSVPPRCPRRQHAALTIPLAVWHELTPRQRQQLAAAVSQLLHRKLMASPKKEERHEHY